MCTLGSSLTIWCAHASATRVCRFRMSIKQVHCVCPWCVDRWKNKITQLSNVLCPVHVWPPDGWIHLILPCHLLGVSIFFMSYVPRLHALPCIYPGCGLSNQHIPEWWCVIFLLLPHSPSYYSLIWFCVTVVLFHGDQNSETLATHTWSCTWHWSSRFPHGHGHAGRFSLFQLW